MSKVFGSSGRRSNPVGVLSILTGLAGAGASALLWIYRVHPSSQILGSYSESLAAGGQLAEQLAALAAVMGFMAIISSIMSSSSGDGGSYFIGFVLGLVGLSYPVMTWLDIVQGPLRPRIFS